MKRRAIPPLFAVIIPLLCAQSTSAHEEWVASLTRFEHVYETAKPLGEIRVKYCAAEAKDGRPSLQVNCGNSSVDVPPAALLDLPGAQWDGLTVAFSLTSFDVKTKRWVDRPYFNLSVPLRGPPGKQWSRTWVYFSFDGDGTFKGRSLKRFSDNVDTNSISVLWKDWPIDKGIEAVDVLPKD
jgi:hypothetical protein